MQIKDIDYVLTLAEYRSFSHASAALYISQPALSRYIANLENRLGVRLFERGGFHLTLTSEGERYVELACAVREKADALTTEMAALSSASKAALHIGMVVRLGWRDLLNDTINVFRSQMPQVQLQVTELLSANLEEGVLNGIYEIGFMSEPPGPSRTQFHRAYQTPLVLVAPKDHPCRSKTVSIDGLPYPWIDLNLLADEYFVLQNHNCRIRGHIEQLIQQEHFQPRVVLQAQSTPSALLYTQAGAGFTFLLARDAESSGNKNLSFFCVGSPLFIVNVGYIQKKNAQLSKPAREFLRIYNQQIESAII